MQKMTNECKILLYSLFLVFSLILCVSTVSADPGIIYVNNETGNDDYDGQNATFDPVTGSGPKLTIVNATGTVTNNGVVNIADGLYTGTGNQLIEITKSMSIIGQTQASTIIDAEGADWIFDVNNPGLTVLFSKLTVKNAYIDWDDGAAIWSEGSTVTVSDCSFIDNYVDNNYDGGAIYNNGGDLTVTNCLFEGNYADRHGGAIYSKNGDVTVTDSTFKKNYAGKDGGAIYNKKGDLIITDSTFKKNKARDDGGAIYHENGALTVTDSLFKKNKARDVGGAIFNDGVATINDSTFNGNIQVGTGDGGSAIFNIGTMTITGSKFKNNDALASDGAAIFTYGDINVSDTKFTNNAGGAIVNYLAQLTVTDCTFTGNFALFNGAGIFNDNGDVTVTDSTFTGNQAIFDGGAIFNADGDMTVTGSTFTENFAANGGGIFTDQGKLTIANCAFTDNWVTADAGSIYNYYGDLTLSGSTFTGNLAHVNAGAIINWGTSNISECNFTSNNATYGGAIYNREGTLTVTGCHITGNHADEDGGAFYWWPNYSTSTVNYNRIVGNTAENFGNAIYSAGSGSANAEYNWWGLNNPVFTDLISGTSTVDYTPWLFMTLTIDPTTINNGETSQLTVSFNNYSTDGTSYTPLPTPLAGHIPDFTAVNFQTDLGSVGSKSIDKSTDTGIATATLTANELADTAHLSATTDSETLYGDVVINPKSSVYLTITPGKANPVVSDTVVYTLKVGNNGPDAAENVVMTYTIPDGLEFAGASDDVGNLWTYDPATRTITWNLGTVPVGDPNLWLSLRIVRAGNYLLNPLLSTTTYDPTLNRDTQSITINAANAEQVNAATTTVGMQQTGLPLVPLIIAGLILVGGLLAPRRIK